MSRDPVVNFSDLSSEKKQEFLSFLLNNNIKFQQGRDNYIAKVTLKDSDIAHKQNRETKNRKDSKDTSRHSPSKKALKQPTQNTPVNTRKKKPLQLTPTNMQNRQKTTPSQSKTVSPLPIKQIKAHHTRNSTVNLEPSQRNHSERNGVRTPSEAKERGRSKSANEKKESHQTITHHQPVHHRIKIKQPQLSNSKVKINTSLQLPKHPHNQQNTPPPQHRQIRQVSSSLSVKSQSYPSNKLQQLISILHIQTVGGGRATRWPRNQVLKIIQQIYSGNFAKNTLLLKHKKIKQTYGSCTFSSYVIEHFEEKYRTPKLLHSNLLNLSHSLLSYIYQGASSSLTLFHLLLIDQYEYQDLMFFLFIRSIFEKEFNTTMEKLLGNGHEHTLTKKQVTRFIKAVLGKDSPEIVAQYQNLVAEYMTDNISVYELFQILLNDYQTKRKCRSENQCYTSNVETGCTISPKNQQSQNPPIQQELIKAGRKSPKNFPIKQMTKSSGQSLFKDGSSSNFQQLTFGEYNASASNRVDEQDQTEFWNDFQPIQINGQDELLEQIQAKLKKKVQELVQIMLGEQSGNHISPLKGPAKQLGRLILGKALRMLQAIAVMDKIKWFRLIRVTRPSQIQLEVVENLQLMLRNLRKISRDNSQLAQARTLQSQFCKSLLTVQQLKRAIQKIVIG